MTIWKFAGRFAASLGLCALGSVLVPAARGQSASQERSPTVSFDSPGVKTVTLRVCNDLGCDTLERTVVVLDPRPGVLSAVTGVNLAGLVPGAPIVARVGDLLRLSGSGNGQPALTLAWQVVQLGTVVAEIHGGDVWWNTAGFAPGIYAARLRVTNPAGEVFSVPSAVTLLANAELSFHTLNPCRVYDSRLTTSPLADGPTGRLVQVAERCGVPANARSVAANLTVVAPSGAGSLSARPGNYPPLSASNVSFAGGATRAGFSVLPLASDGAGTILFTAAVASGGTVHFVVDVSGYFAPL